MKKSLIAAAVLCAAGAASAQSSVTLFGVVDTNLQRVSHSGAGGSSVTRLANSGYQSTRLGFRGQEDLGGGMFAGFWLEAGVNSDDGSAAVATTTNNQAALALSGLVFGRRSTLHLGGTWGEIRLGRDLSPQYRSLSAYDVFGAVGVGSSLTNKILITGQTSVRVSNAIYYFTPTMGGFQAELAHYRGENLSNVANANEGNGWGGRVVYTGGPLSLAAAMGRTDGPPGTKIHQDNLGASYNFGTVTLMGNYARNKVGATSTKGYLLNARATVGAGIVRASYSQVTTDTGPGVDPKASKLAIGYIHNLSKRTALYGTYAKVRNKNGSAQTVFSGAGAPTANNSSTGFDLGIEHAF